jgi:hypothetical protein
VSFESRDWARWRCGSLMRCNLEQSGRPGVTAPSASCVHVDRACYPHISNAAAIHFNAAVGKNVCRRWQCDYDGNSFRRFVVLCYFAPPCERAL